MLTLQQIFTKVATHLLAQGKQARTPGGTCAYRGADGCKCAVGCLIVDDQYDPVIEGLSIRVIDQSGFSQANDEYRARYMKLRSALESSGVDVNNSLVQDVLQRLQEVHDDLAPGVWKLHLEQIAAEHGLLSPWS